MGLILVIIDLIATAIELAILAVLFFLAGFLATAFLDLAGAALLSPARLRERRVRIGNTEWECHDMGDGSQVLLPRGGGARAMQDSGTERASQRFVVRTAQNKWVKLSTAKRGAYSETVIWGQAYKCSRDMAERIARAVRDKGHDAVVEPV